MKSSYEFQPPVVSPDWHPNPYQHAQQFDSEITIGSDAFRQARSQARPLSDELLSAVLASPAKDFGMVGEQSVSLEDFLDRVPVTAEDERLIGDPEALEALSSETARAAKEATLTLHGGKPYFSVLSDACIKNESKYETPQRRIYVNPELISTPMVFTKIMQAVNYAGIDMQAKLFNRPQELAGLQGSVHGVKSLHGDGIILST